MFARKSFAPLSTLSRQIRNATSYRCVVSTSGNVQDVGGVSSDWGGYLGGPFGKGKRLEQVVIDSGYVQGIAPYIKSITINGQPWNFGTVGQGLPITSVNLNVVPSDPSKASLYELQYQAYFSRTGYTGWVPAGTDLSSNNNQLEGLQIVLRVIAAN